MKKKSTPGEAAEEARHQSQGGEVMDKSIKKRKTLPGKIYGVVATVAVSAVAGILANCMGIAFADVMLVAVFGLLMSNEFASEDKEVA